MFLLLYLAEKYGIKLPLVHPHFTSEMFKFIEDDDKANKSEKKNIEKLNRSYSQKEQRKP